MWYRNIIIVKYITVVNTNGNILLIEEKKKKKVLYTRENNIIHEMNENTLYISRSIRAVR